METAQQDLEARISSLETARDTNLATVTRLAEIVRAVNEDLSKVTTLLKRNIESDQVLIQHVKQLEEGFETMRQIVNAHDDQLIHITTLPAFEL